MKLDDGIDKEELKEADNMMRIYARYGSIGLQMLVIMVLFSWCGHWLDGRIGWEHPWLTILFAFIGLAGAIWFLFKETKKLR